jgi:PilX N-terminal
VRARRVADEIGVALLMTVMVLCLLSAMALALALAASIETTISANYRRSVEALFAADAGLERTVADLAAIADWDAILGGRVRSRFVDGPPEGTKVRPDGATLDLSRQTNLANCNRPTACADSELDAVTQDRPWGPNNPRWQPFVYGPVNQWLPADSRASLFYVVAWVADDPSETDGDPRRDGGGASGGESAPPGEGGLGVLLVRVEAFGPAGTHRTIQATVVRGRSAAETGQPPPAVRVIGWREI